ncbi:hypothetical protein CBR_g4735 [Chara braunii]|uniref:Uncharacterized protein n=1 Tax=Chara braunii TaxID=69332 RepID=A0A388KIQ4_CHABU|nr:hypothetical protein CBR_g4735 [Chara braunii]|eukprot:GBG69907.1 hypothetical protein CBR_g4735 [Chara braunii]
MVEERGRLTTEVSVAGKLAVPWAKLIDWELCLLSADGAAAYLGAVIGGDGSADDDDDKYDEDDDDDVD